MANIESDTVKTWARELGADIAGIAPIDRFSGAPPGHDPLDLMPSAQSVIVAGIRVPDAVIEYDRYHLKMNDLTPEKAVPTTVENFYMLMGHYSIDIMLNNLAVRMANRIETTGRFRSLPTPNTVITGLGHPVLGSQFGFFSQRHAATRAGLGEFGFNNIVLTPEFGPRVRFVSVITEAPLAGDPLLKEKICLREKCGGKDGPWCFRKCADGALRLKQGIDHDKVFIDTPAETVLDKCARPGGNHDAACGFMGTCLRACPVGMKFTKRR